MVDKKATPSLKGGDMQQHVPTNRWAAHGRQEVTPLPVLVREIERGKQSMPDGECGFKPVDVGNELVDQAEGDTIQPVDAFLAEDDWSVLYEAGRA
jgi:hypothetical protein